MNKPLNKCLSIDKSNWTRVKLSDVVAEPRDTVKDFSTEQIEHVVGLEHINSEDIHLRRSANMDSSTTFTKKFLMGDVLFGRRRAYLKKAAQAKFSGICSGDITVLRIKEGLLSELLPFVVNNDKFFDYAVKHSAGGLSPRVKFKDLANYEFLLPPKEQQTQLAELFWAMDEVVEKETMVLDRIKNLYDLASLKYILGKERVVDTTESLNMTELGLIPKQWTIKKYKDIAELIHGYQFRENDFTENGIPIIKIGEIGKDGNLNLQNCSYIDLSRLSEFENKIIRNGDILMALTGATLGKICRVSDLKHTVIQNYRVGRFESSSELLKKEYLFYFLSSPVALTQIFGKIHMAAQGNVGKCDIEEIKIPLPSIQEQEIICGILNQMILGIHNSKSIITNSKALQKSLINQIF